MNREGDVIVFLEPDNGSRGRDQPGASYGRREDRGPSRREARSRHVRPGQAGHRAHRRIRGFHPLQRGRGGPRRKRVRAGRHCRCFRPAGRSLQASSHGPQRLGRGPCPYAGRGPRDSSGDRTAGTYGLRMASFSMCATYLEINWSRSSPMTNRSAKSQRS